MTLPHTDEPGPDPVATFLEWFREAHAAEPDVPDAVSLATVGADGRPAVRMVLLKGVSAAGLDFFTNRESRKGREIAANPAVALCAHWKTLGRQVRVEGDATPLSDAEGDRYWATRDRGSQLSAWASVQSRPIAARADLEAAREAQLERFGNEAEIPRPPFWGGYRVVAVRWEFWITRDHRLHDRFDYAWDGAAWIRTRLQP